MSNNMNDDKIYEEHKRVMKSLGLPAQPREKALAHYKHSTNPKTIADNKEKGKVKLKMIKKLGNTIKSIEGNNGDEDRLERHMK